MAQRSSFEVGRITIAWKFLAGILMVACGLSMPSAWAKSLKDSCPSNGYVEGATISMINTGVGMSGPIRLGVRLNGDEWYEREITTGDGHVNGDFVYVQIAMWAFENHFTVNACVGMGALQGLELEEMNFSGEDLGNEG